MFLAPVRVPFDQMMRPLTEYGSEFLNYEGGKFSKSRNLGVFGTQAQETGVPASVWRYYLLANRPESGDSMFSWSDFVRMSFIRS